MDLTPIPMKRYELITQWGLYHLERAIVLATFGIVVPPSWAIIYTLKRCRFQDL